MSNCWYRWTKFNEPLQLWIWNFAIIHTQLLRFFRKRTFQQVWKRILILGQKFDPSSNRLKSLIEGHLRLPKQECISKAFFFSTCFHPKANFWKNFQHNLQCLKITQKCHIWVFQFWHFPSIIDLSGNTVWPQASGFQKVAKMDNFCPLKK